MTENNDDGTESAKMIMMATATTTIPYAPRLPTSTQQSNALSFLHEHINRMRALSWTLKNKKQQKNKAQTSIQMLP